MKLKLKNKDTVIILVLVLLIVATKFGIAVNKDNIEINLADNQSTIDLEIEEEKIILVHTFGIGGSELMRQEDIGEIVGVGQSTISKKRKASLNKLKKLIQKIDR